MKTDPTTKAAKKAGAAKKGEKADPAAKKAANPAVEEADKAVEAAKAAATAGGMKPAAAKAQIDQAKAIKGALNGKPRPCPPDRTADWEDCKQ